METTSETHTALVTLPRWTAPMRAQLSAARICTSREADEAFSEQRTSVSLEVQADDEREARVRIMRALFPLVGPGDFGSVAAPRRTNDS